MDTEKPEIDTGNAAFPAPSAYGRFPGMSLLDYFAAQALPAAIELPIGQTAIRECEAALGRTGVKAHDLVAWRAYKFAEAMIRRKRELEEKTNAS